MDDADKGIEDLLLELQTLRKKDQQWQRIFQQAMDAVLVVDAEADRITDANDAALDLYGYSLDEFVGMKADAICADSAKAETIILRGVGNVVDKVGVRLHKRKDGTVFPASVRTVVFDVAGQRILCSIVRDVTTYRWTQEELQRVRAALDGASNSVLIIDLNGKAIYSNRAFETLLEYTLDELNEAGVGSIWADPRAAEQAAGVGRDAWRDEVTMRSKTGHRFPAAVHASPVLGDAGQVIDTLFLITDITERKRAEARIERAMAELERSNQELRQFAYVASHDLQEPLRMVGSYVDLLAKRYKGTLDQEADEFIEFASDGVARMHALIRDLLLYSRVGTRSKPFQPTNCEAVLQDALANLQVAVDETGGRVTHDHLPVITADESQIGQLLQNLVGNAIKFRGAEPPRVHVSAERQGLEWVFSVRDNGLGFEQEHAERVFKVFQRLHGPDDYDGTGIGLAICRKIVERHGGGIWVESKPGKGSTFFFTIPARPDE